MRELVCWFVQCGGGHHASDVGRAAPEINADALFSGFLVIGIVLFILSDRWRARSYRTGRKERGLAVSCCPPVRTDDMSPDVSSESHSHEVRP